MPSAMADGQARAAARIDDDERPRPWGRTQYWWKEDEEIERLAGYRGGPPSSPRHLILASHGGKEPSHLQLALDAASRDDRRRAYALAWHREKRDRCGDEEALRREPLIPSAAPE